MNVKKHSHYLRSNTKENQNERHKSTRTTYRAASTERFNSSTRTIEKRELHIDREK
jgi:hypothetical protein